MTSRELFVWIGCGFFLPVLGHNTIQREMLEVMTAGRHPLLAGSVVGGIPSAPPITNAAIAAGFLKGLGCTIEETCRSLREFEGGLF